MAALTFIVIAAYPISTIISVLSAVLVVVLIPIVSAFLFLRAPRRSPQDSRRQQSPRGSRTIGVIWLIAGLGALGQGIYRTITDHIPSFYLAVGIVYLVGAFYYFRKAGTLSTNSSASQPSEVE